MVQRETWGAKAEFILSSMGFSIGLGNVWRFPYLCYDNGGGAFLIPYIIMIAVGAIPVLIIEAGLGQFTSQGCISCWEISPLFKGIGISMVLLSVYFSLYYNILITYILHYMFSSFITPLPWVGCEHSWNTDQCFDSSVRNNSGINSTNNEMISSVINLANQSVMDLLGSNSSYGTTGSVTGSVRASEEYWKYHVLNISDGLHDIGLVQWRLLLCFIASWVIVYLCIIKGVKSSGKVVYFTATFPYVILFILLIRGVTLPGAAKGIVFFIKPKWGKLLCIQVWKAAANQVFFSFAAGYGGILTMSSYNKFKNNCYRDIIIVSTTCGLTSLFSGFVIFSAIGFMAWDSNVQVEDVVQSGPGLAFIAFAEAVARLPVPQLWSVLFFFMLLLVGLDSQFVTMEVIITATIDEVEHFKQGIRKYKGYVVFGSCFIFMICGLPLTTRGGIYILILFDWYAAGFTPMILAFIETIIISYAYGTKRFMQDIHSMIGYTPGLYWQICWMFITPSILVVIYIASFTDYSAARVGDYTFPPWAEAIGWLLTTSSIVVMILYAVILLYKMNGSLTERLRHSIQPSATWGPANNEDRVEAGYPTVVKYNEDSANNADRVEAGYPTIVKDNENCLENGELNEISGTKSSFV